MAYRQRGNAYFSKNEYSRAIADYDRAIELEPEVAKAYFNRGSLYQAIGEKEKASIDFRKVLELHNDSDIERAAQEQLAVLGEKKIGRAA
jgi:tetratricopeptide (TPR) repeat protein